MTYIEDATRQTKNWLNAKNLLPWCFRHSNYRDFLLAIPQKLFVSSGSSQNPRSSIPEPTLCSELFPRSPILSSPRVRSVWTTH